MQTPYEIANEAEHLEPEHNRRAIINAYRQMDDSNNGKFNATRKAERLLKRFERVTERMYGLELSLWMHQTISHIVNCETCQSSNTSWCKEYRL